jgi:hypothetical protein
LAVLTTFLTPRVDAQQEPFFRTILSYHELVLPASMTRLLAQAHPGFRPWQISDFDPDIQQSYKFTGHQAPWAVIGDFNGDGVTDVVIDGHDDAVAYRICLVSVAGDTAYAALTLETDTYPPRGPRSRELLHQGPGVVGTNYDDSTLTITTEAFHDYFFEKAAIMYYWQQDHFAKFDSAD